MYLEIYLTDTLYTLDREKVDEVLRELFRRIAMEKVHGIEHGKNKNTLRRLRSSFLM